jgi:NhaC family Na+:H+ antiporter
MPAIPALSIGVLAGVLCVVFFQRNTMSNDITYELLHNIILGTNQPSTDSEEMKNLLTTGGMAGMLNTIWLILSAMFFGGIMEACGFLNRMTSALLHRAKGDTALTAATALSAVTVNISASDQYLAIVIPGRMFAGSFHDQQLAAENLTRTLEDAGTVTSPLIPWNTCGAYQSNILGVNALAFAPFAFFNILSPIATLVFMKLNIKIKRIKQDNTSSKI